MKVAHILYTHNTITDDQIAMAKESIDLAYPPLFKPEFIEFDTRGIVGSVAGDVAEQVDEISGFDIYICHKLDFYLAKNSCSAAVNKLIMAAEPTFINFSKFDLRENVSKTETRLMAQLTFDQILQFDFACDMTDATPLDFGTQYTAMGYRGFDGVMHAYNEAARKRLHVDSYWEEYSIRTNQVFGIDMQYGDVDIFALHMFHELPGGRFSSLKNIPGHRF